MAIFTYSGLWPGVMQNVSQAPTSGHIVVLDGRRPVNYKKTRGIALRLRRIHRPIWSCILFRCSLVGTKAGHLRGHPGRNRLHRRQCPISLCVSPAYTFKPVYSRLTVPRISGSYNSIARVRSNRLQIAWPGLSVAIDRPRCASNSTLRPEPSRSIGKW